MNEKLVKFFYNKFTKKYPLPVVSIPKATGNYLYRWWYLRSYLTPIREYQQSLESDFSRMKGEEMIQGMRLLAKDVTAFIASWDKRRTKERIAISSQVKIKVTDIPHLIYSSKHASYHNQTCPVEYSRAELFPYEAFLEQAEVPFTIEGDGDYKLLAHCEPYIADAIFARHSSQDFIKVWQSRGINFRVICPTWDLVKC